MLETLPETSTVASSLASRPQISFEDFLVEYDGQFAEWIDGEAILRMSTSFRHQDLCDFLIAILRCFVEEKDLGVIVTAPMIIKLSKTRRGREPDLFFVAKRNAKRLKKNYLDGAADLVIEIISPESRGRDRGDKFFEYEKEGIQEYWLIDYERGQAEFYQLDDKGIYQLVRPDDTGVYHSQSLKGLQLQTEWLWREKLPTLLEVLREWRLIA